jgi:hypothetical protein
MRYALASALALCALAAQAVPQKTAQRKVPCKTPENAASCYWTRGRITCCNGNPAMRMWKVGTKRILGILSGPDSQRHDLEDSLHPEIPANLDEAYQAEYKHRVAINDPEAGLSEPVFADFEVCPLEPEHPRKMQPVCIESAKKIFFQKYEPVRRK